MQPRRLNDPRRLAAIRRLGLLDSPPEEVIDRLTRIAAGILNAPVALCSIVAADRQFFKSAFGLPEPIATHRGTPLTHSFCQHVVLGLKPLVVDDARKDERLRGNKAVEEWSAISYAGMPLLSPDGEALGSFCVIDNKPREWTPKELEMLKELADIVMREFRLRDMTRELFIEHSIRQELTESLVQDLSTPLERMSFVLQTSDPVMGLPAPDVDDVLSDAQRLTMKLNDLVDVSRLETGKLEPSLQGVDLDEILASALARTYPTALEKQITVEARMPEQLPEVVGDPDILVRVVENMLRHAIRFTDPGSLVFIEATQVSDNEVRCSVSDTGMGLTEDVRASLFNTALPDIQSADEEPTSGLGLTYARAAIEALGGTIGVFSQEGVGTTVWFCLNVAE